MTDAENQIRLIDLTFLDGARQLAMSEAIMTAVGQGAAPPTLRLYSWSEPVVILGVGQPASDLDLDVVRARGYRILRRIGGGTAVYHDADEVSVDFIVQTGSQLGPTDVHAGYRQFAALLEDALGQVDIRTSTVTVEQARAVTPDPVLRPICFASVSPFEFFHNLRKLDGICQIRRRDAITYQAAIYNRFPVEPMIASITHECESIREYRRQRLTEFATDMETARGEPVDYAELQNSLVRSVTRLLDVDVVPGSLTGFEQRETERLIAEKYANDSWTFRR